MTDDQTLQQNLLDKQAIVEVTHRYCWALDEKRFEELRAVFTADAVGHLGLGGQQGVEQIIERVSVALAQFSVTQHMVSTHQIMLDGDEASGRCYLQAQHVTPPAEEGGEPSHYLVGARYEDRYRRTAEGWRIAERAILPMWSSRTSTPNSNRF